jgi:hypothetical protein
MSFYNVDWHKYFGGFVKMKRRKKFGFVVFVVFLAFSVITCEMNPEEKNPFKGTWVSTEGYTAVFEDSSWTIPQYSSGKGLKGTYTYVDNTASIIFTEISDDGVNWQSITSSEASAYTRIATISGNTLTWGITRYTKRK